MSKRFLARLKATAKYAKDCWAKSLGPTMVSVAAVNLAYLTGTLGVWWPTALAAALCGLALSWATSVAEARAQTEWAGVLIKTLASGEDTTITVEHFHATKRDSHE